MSITLKHEALGVEYRLPEMRQRDVEAFQKAYLSGVKDCQGVYEKAGLTVRIAARLGWLAGLSEDVVGDMKPSVCLFLHIGIHNAIREATTIPPV